MAFGKEGKRDHDFNAPRGISIHPFSKKVYIADYYNHRLQILNLDLTFCSSFGHRGSDDGQFGHPSDVACDGTENVYVANAGNYCIQVFTAEGEFVRKFGQRGEGNGELHSPTGICIDSDDVVCISTVVFQYSLMRASF